MQRRGDEAHAAYPEVKIARTIDEVLHDDQVDLVVLGTPNETHFTLAREVLQAGKHCVVDKPFAATSSEAAELSRLASEAGKLVIPFHNRRFDGDFLTVWHLLDEGTCGRIVEISSRFDRFRPSVRENSWKESANPMSGLLFDLGTHLLDQALALFGEPHSMDARVYQDRTGTGVDDAFELTLEYADRGLRYRCGSTLLAAEPQPRFRINGTLGSYTKYGVDPQEAAVAGGRRPPELRSPAPWLPEEETAWGTLTTVAGSQHPSQPVTTQVPTIPGDYRLFYENVRDAIWDVAELKITAEDGRRCIRLVELAQQSNSEKRSVAVTF